MVALTLSGLFVYPLKSAAGISVERSNLTTRGLQGDRRYMLVSPEGHFLTQRRFPKMSLIRTAFVNAGEETATDLSLKVEAPSMSSLEVQQPSEDAPTAQAIEVDVWGDRILALSCGETAQAWFSEFLSTPCQLVYMPASTLRPTDHGRFGTDKIVSFADAYPYLLLSQASLDGLNQKLSAKQAAPVPMNRFRPNLVISGECAPHAEDEWKRIRVGKVVFNVAKPCARCSIPNVDQTNGQRTKEPSQTLAGYRAWDKEIWFGQNLIQEISEPNSLGLLQVGAAVEILA
ncbi:MAG: MOSC N-terminal beta barrel domain-containing protein [Cyanobacteria bacterium J06588_5]